MERVAVVVIAGIALVLGWELMRRRLSSGDAEIQHGSIRIALRRVGPGIIFALFGAVVLGYAIAKPVSVEIVENRSLRDLISQAGKSEDKGADGMVAESRTFKISQATGRPDNAHALKTVVSLNKVIRLAEMDRTDVHTLQAASDEVASGLDQFKALRNEIVISVIGKDNFEKWQRDGATFRQDATRFSQQDRERLSEIALWFEKE